MKTYVLLLLIAVPALADTTHLRGNGFTAAGGIVAPPVYETLSTDVLFSIVRPFNIGSQPYLALINGHTGRVQLRHLAAGGGFQGAPSDDQTNVYLRCTNAAVLSQPLGAKLVLHDAFKGTLVMVDITAAGTLFVAGATEVASLTLKDKNVFDAFQLGGQWKLFGLDTFTGKVATYSDLGVDLATDTWTTGYTSVDHLTVGASTFRVLYKAAGDPNKLPGEVGDSAGQLVVQKVSATGMSASTLFSGINLPLYSAVRFATIPLAGGGFAYRVLLYDRVSGNLRSANFDPVSGVVSFIWAQVAADARWSDVEPYIVVGTAFLALLSDDGMVPFNYDQVERMARAIHDRLATRVAGYQLALSQSGRVIYQRAFGKAGLGAHDRAMTSRTRLDIGSISKMVMAISMLRMQQVGLVNLSLPIKTYLKPGSPKGWTQSMNLWNAMTHTTGMSAGGCDSDEGTLRMDCTNFYKASQDGSLFFPNGNATPTDDYVWRYNNSNIAVARDVFETTLGIADSTGIPQAVGDLWAPPPLSTDVSELTCQHDPNVYYFGPCRGAAGCVSGASGDDYQQSHIIEDWSSTCSAGGWSTSSRRLIELLDEIRYQRILGLSAEQATLVSTSLTSGGSPTAFGWEPPFTVNGVQGLGKNGANDDKDSTAAFQAQVYRLDNNVDAVLMLNTAGVGAGGVLFDGYLYGLDPTYAIPRFIDEDVIAVPGTFTKAALNESSEEVVYGSFDYVTAARNQDGMLQLNAFDVNTGLQATQTDEEITDIAADDVAVTDGAVFATAARQPSGQLKLTWWNHSMGELYRRASVDGPMVKAQDVARAALAPVFVTRVAVFSQLDSGALQLDIYDHDLLADHVESKASVLVGVGSAPTIQPLVVGTLISPASRVVLAFRNSAGQLNLQTWAIDADGSPSMLGQTTATTVFAGASQRPIAIDQKGDHSAFFGGNGFVTSSIDSAGNIEMRSWQVDGAGNIFAKDFKTSTFQVSSLDALALTSVVRSTTGPLILFAWSLNPATGALTFVHKLQLGSVQQVMTAGGRTVAYRTPANELKLMTIRAVP